MVFANRGPPTSSTRRQFERRSIKLRRRARITALSVGATFPAFVLIRRSRGPETPQPIRIRARSVVWFPSCNRGVPGDNWHERAHFYFAVGWTQFSPPPSSRRNRGQLLIAWRWQGGYSDPGIRSSVPRIRSLSRNRSGAVCSLLPGTALMGARNDCEVVEVGVREIRA